LVASLGGGNAVAVVGSRVQCFWAAVPDIYGIAPPSAGIAWLSSRELISGEAQWLSRFRVGAGGVHPEGYATAPGGLVGLTLSPDRSRVALAIWEDDGVHVVSATPPPTSGHTQLKVEQRLLLVAGGGPGVRLQWR
jgi:hypothetical protein